MQKLIDRIYQALMADDPDVKITFGRKLAIVGLVFSFIIAFIIITSQFILQNISL